MTDLISRADAIEAVEQEYKIDRGYMVDDYTYGFNQAIHYVSDIILPDLPSAETHEIRTETHGVCLISKDDAMGAVQDHFNADGFKGYDDGQKMMDRIKALPSADAEQVTSKLNNSCDSLLKDDSAECKEQKSKLEHDREWIIGCIEHDGFIHTHRFDKANQIIHDALSAEAEWIPCSERLPEDSGDYLVCLSNGVIEDYSDCRDVMIMPYDADCEAFGWWTERYDPISLGFVDSDFNEFEVLAWMPLPKPYRGEQIDSNT